MNMNTDTSSFPRICWRLSRKNTTTLRKAPWNYCGRRSGELWASHRSGKAIPQFKPWYWSAIESWMGALRSSWARTTHTSLQVGTSQCMTSQLANISTGDQSTTSHQANRDVVGSLVTNLIWFRRFLRSTRLPETTRTPWRCYVSCLSIHYNSWHSLLLQCTRLGLINPLLRRFLVDSWGSLVVFVRKGIGRFIWIKHRILSTLSFLGKK